MDRKEESSSDGECVSKGSDQNSDLEECVNEGVDECNLTKSFPCGLCSNPHFSIRC